MTDPVVAVFILLVVLTLTSLNWVLVYLILSLFWMAITFKDPGHKIRALVSFQNALLGSLFMFVLYTVILLMGGSFYGISLRN